MRIVGAVVPVGHPFPDVTRHVVETVGALAPFIVAHRHEHLRVAESRTKPIVRKLWRRILHAPWKWPLVRPARRFFPFRFGRQTLAGPSAKRIGIVPIHPDDRTV